MFKSTLKNKVITSYNDVLTRIIVFRVREWLAWSGWCRCCRWGGWGGWGGCFRWSVISKIYILLVTSYRNYVIVAIDMGTFSRTL